MNTRPLALLLLGIALGYSQTTAGDPPQVQTPPDRTQAAAPDQTPPPAPEMTPAAGQDQAQASSQDQAQASSPDQPKPAAEDQAQAAASNQPATPPASPIQTPTQASRSVIKPQPGGQLIKPKDYSDQSGYFHPFVRMGHYFIDDQKAIWTSPFHTSKKQAKYWLIFGGITGALIATDKYVARNAPDTATLRTAGNDVSYLGQAYTLLPIAAGWYFLGTAMGSDHFREAGLLTFESVANTTVVMTVLKVIFDRQRPFEPPGHGEFWKSSQARYNSSFPSGHAITTMAVASVLVHEYPHKLWLKFVAYGYVAGVMGARLAANQHFPGDVASGAALGWFISDYVYGKRHNPALDKKHTAEDWVIDHVHLGLGM